MEPGADVAAQRVFEVGAGDTAEALGSGNLPVLGTPRLLAWCEAVTCAAVEDGLASGETSVGTSVHLEHLAPSAVGDTVTVRARRTSSEGRRLRLAVTATAADGGPLARGTVERVVVDAAGFLERLG
jgi:fluoroacetyl-CoA thioesterase